MNQGWNPESHFIVEFDVLIVLLGIIDVAIDGSSSLNQIRILRNRLAALCLIFTSKINFFEEF